MTLVVREGSVAIASLNSNTEDINILPIVRQIVCKTHHDLVFVYCLKETQLQLLVVHVLDGACVLGLWR